MDSNKLVVHRIVTHYGHSADVEYLRISNADKKQIASKLVEGVSTGRILDDTRNNISCKRKRVYLLTKQDLDNIKRSYNIHSKEGVKHVNDAISVELWVEECRALEHNPVLLYKPQGEPLEPFENADFCLILMNDLEESLLKQFGGNILAIDSTHGLNNYDFELTTLMIVDEFNEGFPVAFMFSNKKDTFINTIFFTMIKQKVGTIQSYTFMSDITGTFYNGWLQVMTLPNHQLYCSWHVDRAWRTNLNKIANKEKRVWVYKTLKCLQTNTDFDNTDAFCEQLQVAVNNMFDDNDTKIFGEYFLKNYSNNYQKWAYWFRQDCGINTNMRLESMHKVIKYFYLNGKCVKRLDKGLHATLKYLRDKTVDRLIKHTKGKRTCKSSENFKSHRLAVVSNFDITVQSPGVWAVSNSNNGYVVKTSNLEKCCNFICQFCNICVHQFSCTCPNYFINAVICKHIHFVVLQSSANNDAKNELENIGRESAIDECLSFFDATNTQNVSSCTRKENILKELSNLQTLVNNSDFDSVSDSVFRQIIGNINTAKNLLQLPSTSKPTLVESFKDKKELSARQNISPQMRFISTQKRKKKTKDALKHPSKDENDDILAILKGVNIPHISTNSNLDHNYM